MAKKRIPTPELTFKLDRLYVQECSATRKGVRRGAQPPQHLAITCAVQVGSTEGSSDELVVLLTLSAGARYDEDSNDHAALLVAEYHCFYRVTGALATEVARDKGWSVKLAMSRSTTDAWPYFREFVETSTVRMGMPALRAPFEVPNFPDLKYTHRDEKKFV